jgi:hypothetical protein
MGPLFVIEVSTSLIFMLQFGVSNVDELRQALGTSVEAPAKKVFQESAPQEERVQEKIVTEDASTDELVYTDSSTFLKVGSCNNSLVL